MAGVDQDVLDMARGLIDSRVVVKRPPSAAQRKAYHATPRGPPMLPKEKKTRPFSAKARISTENDTKKSTMALPAHRPPWRPFTRESSLSKMDTTGILERQLPNEMGEKMQSEKEEEKTPSIYQNRTLPQGLSTLSQWLTEEVPSDWAQGYSPASSFVFLPCLHSMCEGLPCVPTVQEPGEELPYAPLPQTQKYKPPTCKQPRLKKTSGQESGKQGPKSNLSGDDETNSINHIRMYNKDGELIHDVYRGKRTEEIIRQEIEDLERLLKGIGNPEGSSVVVRYQHDINHLQDMVKSTIESYTLPDDDRPSTPVAAALQEDLVKYPAKHDKIMDAIRKRRDECVEELAAIERQIITGKI